MPYADLRDFLSQHIADSEKPNDPENEAVDLADDFIEFVRKRAGLLIEVGENQYSFVHLTFQEYLTSSHIITVGEKGGAEGIWEMIRDRCDDARWVEVVRLLVAGLKSNDSQQFILERILDLERGETGTTRSQLLGGLLVDGIEPAQSHSGDIVRQVILSARGVEDVKRLVPIMSVLDTWGARDSANEGVIAETFMSAFTSNTPAEERLALALLAAGTNLSEATSAGLTEALLAKEASERLAFDFLLGDVGDIGKLDSLRAKFAQCLRWEHSYLLTSSLQNLVAAVTFSLSAQLPPDVMRRLAFEQQMVALASHSIGPFHELLLHESLVAMGGGASPIGQGRQRKGYEKEAKSFLADLAKARGELAEAARGPVEKRADHGIAKVHHRARALAGASFRERERNNDADFQLDLARRSAMENDPRGRGKKTETQTFWERILATPELVAAVLDFLCDVFDLSPRAYWWQALRRRFLPRAPNRMTKILRPDLGWPVEGGLAADGIPDAVAYGLAWELLVDCWVRIFEADELPEGSRIGRAAGDTPGMDLAPLRVAHCIRDIAYGNADRVADLRRMVESPDPAYRSLFERCLWIDN